MRVFPYTILFLLTISGLVMLIFHLNELPERVATHFNGAGEPDGFMSRAGYAAMMMGLLVGMPAFLIGITKATRYLPTSLINMPNKDYWLHESRRDDTLRVMEALLVWISCITEVLFIGIQQLTYSANVRQENLSSTGMLVLMGFFFVGIVCSCRPSRR